MVTKYKQWCTFKGLRLSITYKGYNTLKYASNIQVPYYHPLNLWLLGATNSNHGQTALCTPPCPPCPLNTPPCPLNAPLCAPLHPICTPSMPSVPLCTPSTPPLHPLLAVRTPYVSPPCPLCAPSMPPLCPSALPLHPLCSSPHPRGVWRSCDWSIALGGFWLVSGPHPIQSHYCFIEVSLT